MKGMYDLVGHGFIALIFDLFSVILTSFSNLEIYIFNLSIIQTKPTLIMRKYYVFFLVALLSVNVFSQRVIDE